MSCLLAMVVNSKQVRDGMTYQRNASRSENFGEIDRRKTCI